MSSFRKDRLMALASHDLNSKSLEELKATARELLENGLHGLCFSAYLEGQQPGDILTEEQVRRRMEILSPYTGWVRSFSCIEGNELIPKIAKEYGLKTLVGAWLGSDKTLNAQEIDSLIELCNQGYVDIAAVGNEVLYRNDLEKDQLLSHIYQVKDAVKDTPIGYVDAYYEFTQHPDITEACDVILANCYPFWEGCHNDYALLYMKQMYQQAQSAAPHKKVIITETGWPSQGSSLKDSHAGEANALKYFINSQQWLAQDDIEMFYFTSFDENWKVGDEGDVGAYWGLWDQNEQLKF